MLTFEQRRKAICSNPPQGGHRIKPRCNWMFDNEIDWVKKYKAEQASLLSKREVQYRKFVFREGVFS
jgi:hypothetical protein